MTGIRYQGGMRVIVSKLYFDRINLRWILSITCSLQVWNNLAEIKVYFGCTFIDKLSFVDLLSSNHTASFWNITIQWTSHDDFTELFLCLSILNSNWKNSWNQSVKKVTQMIWQNFSVLALKNVSKTFKSIWKPNPCLDLLEKKYIVSEFTLFFAG